MRLKQLLTEDPDSVDLPNGRELEYVDGATTFILFDNFMMWGTQTHGYLYNILQISNTEHVFNIRCKNDNINYIGEFETGKRNFSYHDPDGEGADDGDLLGSYYIGDLDGRVWIKDKVVSCWNHDSEVIENLDLLIKFLSNGLKIGDVYNIKYEVQDYISGVDEAFISLGELKTMKEQGSRSIKNKKHAEQMQLQMLYHTTTDPKKKKAIASKLGITKSRDIDEPDPNFLYQWQKDKARGLAEYKKTIKELHNL